MGESLASFGEHVFSVKTEDIRKLIGIFFICNKLERKIAGVPNDNLIANGAISVFSRSRPKGMRNLRFFLDGKRGSKVDREEK